MLCWEEAGQRFVYSLAFLEPFLRKWSPYPVKLYTCFRWASFSNLSFLIYSSYIMSLPSLET